eukprot:364294-Chlamydomonas_euryale.AAC.3
MAFMTILSQQSLARYAKTLATVTRVLALGATNQATASKTAPTILAATTTIAIPPAPCSGVGARARAHFANDTGGRREGSGHGAGGSDAPGTFIPMPTMHAPMADFLSFLRHLLPPPGAKAATHL